MSQSVVTQVREACLWAKAAGHPLLRGCWFDFTREPWGCDPLGALLLQHGHVTGPAEHLGQPGYSALVRTLLEVDNFWLRRFWLGWDRGYQVLLVTDDAESKDSVSTWAIALCKEFTASG